MLREVKISLNVKEMDRVKSLKCPSILYMKGFLKAWTHLGRIDPT